jgi:hypothetical protein
MQHLEPELAPARPPPPEDASAAELLRDAVSEARQLITLEVSLAKDEMRREVVSAKSAGIALGASAVAAIVALALLFTALALAIFPGPVPALLLGLILMVGATLGAIAGMKLLPRKPLEDTRRRFGTNVESLKESVR